LPLGILCDQAYGQSSVTLEESDLLLLYTDGITEAVAPRTSPGPRELFGIDRLDRVLLDCHRRGAESCVARIRAEVCAFSGNSPPTDDQTLIAIRCQ
jgi:sigma-B regulation protein RsbU (phosphoserine phosphatase)